VGVTAQQLSVGTEQLLRDLLEALIEFAPENFLDRALRARLHPVAVTRAKGPHLIERMISISALHCASFLADEWVFGGGPSVTLDGPREFDEAGDVAFEDEMQASAVGTALVHQRAHRHIPSRHSLCPGYSQPARERRERTTR